MPKIYLISAVFAGVALLMSFSANPPDGFSGAPGDGICSNCHTLNGGTQDGSIVLTGFPATIQPSTAYVLTITNSNPNGVASRAGFQMTILNSSNQQAGTLSSPSSSSTVSSSGGRQYWEHNPFVNYPMNNMVTWTVTWTSPTGPPSTNITYYAAGNVANGNGSTTGDLIVTSTGSGTLDSGVDPLVAEIASFTDVLCNGENTGSATAGATGGTPPYMYNWSNGGSGATINNLVAGTYVVTVTDNTSTTATASVTISQPAILSFSPPVITHVSCNGQSNGSIQANASGGVQPYSYFWSNGGSGSTISGLAAGSYTVTVTDDNDCTESITYQVNQPAVLTIALVTLEHESCLGEEDGSITISVSGGTPTYFAEWSNGSIGTSISGLEPDTYSVTVTDNNNCTATASYTINPGSTVNANLIQIQHASCNGASDGLLTIAGTGGVAPYSYAWSNGGSGPTISNIPAGNYLVTVTDANNCQVIKAYTINQPAPITIQITATGENLCGTDNLVTLTATPMGDNGPYTGLWSNGITGMVNSGLAAGTYTITVTDANDCTAISSFQVTSPPLLVVTVSTTPETDEDANDGTASAGVAGGTPDYTYLWSNGESVPDITGLAPGIYTVTVTDMNGCTASASGQVTPFGCTLEVSIAAGSLLLCPGDSTQLEAIVTGEVGDIAYLWSNGAITSGILTGAGIYCVTVTDEAGCQQEACIDIETVPSPVLVCPVTHESAPGASDGAIQCEDVPGIVAYLWSNGASTSGIADLPPGVYCVTVTDEDGCTFEQCFDVLQGGCQLIVTSIFTDVSCHGHADGSISVNVSNATDPVVYTWSNGDTTSVISGLTAGEYVLFIEDGAGCTDVREFEIVEPDPLSVTVDSIGNIGTQDGYIAVTVNGGTPPYTFNWITPLGNQITEEDPSGLTEPGYYFLFLMDANACAYTLDSVWVDIMISVQPEPVFKTLLVYPVPATDMLIMQHDVPITEVQIMGADGRMYQRILHPDSNRLRIGELESGWYILRMTDGQNWYIARMVK